MSSTRWACIVLWFLLAGCTTLPPKDEFAALSCQQQTALLYDYAKENRRWAIAGAVTGAFGIVTGVSGILAAKKVGDSVAAMAAGTP